MRELIGVFCVGWANTLLGITHISNYISEEGVWSALGLIFGSFHIMMVLVLAGLIMESLNE